uniref:NADH-ubiquinone oxidoreductase chain 2 n=1 Tax=Crypsis chinensis TaxID=2984370 RepID=A0A978AZY6_9CUCU|nr:NADH dehydrogenase subunit 2 [Crypsis chinensis]UYB79082.1 NADH dehydrogenase subunit 2 [Crypsis chinensis]
MFLMQIMFMSTLVLGTMLTISASSWMLMWMGLEINLISFIPLMTKPKNKISVEASMKYFITQALASMVLLSAILMSFLLNAFILPSMNAFMMIPMSVALFLKLGAAPFHFWFPQVMEGLSWNNAFILMTWQKIAPIMILMNTSLNMILAMSVMMSSLMISGFMSFSQTSMKKIMAYSSINHIAWLLGSLLASWSAWLIYMLTYIMMNFMIIFYIKTYNLNYLSQMNSSSMNSTVKMSFMINFLSLAGLPPLIGFIPKWIVINNMTPWMLSMTAILIISTVIMIYIYMRIMVPSLILNNESLKVSSIKTPKTMLALTNSINLMILPIITLIQFFM